MSERLSVLPDFLWEKIVCTGLEEDFGVGGDLTTEALTRDGQMVKGVFRARQPGIVVGWQAAKIAFRLLDPEIRFSIFCQDGTRVHAGEPLAEVEGRASGVLGGERTALNLLSHLSGIASATREIVEAVALYKAQICCTRKTLPGMRAIQKYAVRAGGGVNHRYRLDDAILIKDNHIALSGGVANALELARARAGHMVKIALEVDTLEQLDAAIQCGGVDAYLFDNMSIDMLERAVAMVGGNAITEASGGITPQTASAIAATGVDILSLGWLTHSAKALDIGLDLDI